jgi:RNA polymerase sigma factor (sigma-70 family)
VSDRDEDDAFHRVFAEHAPAISRMAWGYVDNSADHDDLVQEICLAIWRALPGFRGESSMWTFVFRVARNRALSFIGRRRRDEPLSPDAADPRPGPDAQVEALLNQERLRAAIRRLPEPQRLAVLLHLEDASVREIAVVQGTTENNVAVRLTRARQALRELLKEAP